MSELEKVIGIHKAGTIRRVKLQNFLTYGSVEFFPGPRLNMVVGPNGTGKSTILCAICLGLGGEPRLLGRADDARLFIMHEKAVAIIEIELEPSNGGETHILKRKIDRSKGGQQGRGASTFYINGIKANAKRVKELVTNTYHISIDNLCTFLPQDRVGNFSGFGPQDLLIETEKSMSSSGHLYETHQKLISLEAELREGGNEVETIEEKLKRMETDNSRLEREVERIEEREEAERQLDLLSKKFVWLKFDECREATQALKVEKDAARAKTRQAHQDLEPLKEALGDLTTKKQRYNDHFKLLQEDASKGKKEMDKLHAKAEKHSEDMDEQLTQLNSLDAQQRAAKKKVEAQEEKVRKCEAELERLPSKESVDEAQAEAAAEFRSLRPEFTQAQRELSRCRDAVKELQEAKGHKLSKLAKMNDEKTQIKQRVHRTFPELERITQWVEQNKTSFRRPVIGPVICEITTKSNNAAAYIEFHVPNATLKAFIVECKHDYDLLYREVRGKMNLPVNVMVVANGKLDPVERIYSDSKYRILKEKHGVSGYLDEAFAAPDAILQALRNAAKVDKVLVGGTKTQKSIDDADLLDYLSQPERAGDHGQGYSIFACKGEKSFRFQGSVSRYSHKMALGIDEVRTPRYLKAGVNPAKKAELEKEIEELNGELRTAEKQHQEVQSRFETIQKQAQEAKARLKHAKDAQDSVSKAQTRLRTAQRKLKDLQEEAGSDTSEEKDKLMRVIQARMASSIAALEAHADQQTKTMQTTFTLAGVRINQDITTVAEREAKEALNDAQKEFAELERESGNIVRAFNEKRDMMREMKQLAEEQAPIVDEDGNPTPLKAELEALPVNSLAETEAAMEEAKAKVNGIDANPEVIRQYEERKKEIELIRAQLEELTQSKESKVFEIERKSKPWEIALVNSVQKVNELFSDYMAELGCAGEVKLTKGTSDDNDDSPSRNFKDWGIAIQVKFREKSKMQTLSARVHSGGERSVSTIMYLMALQELMVSPFRCVDEINQGLDERNERLVFKRIVENSTRPPSSPGDLTSHSGQYFLITPKLLPNLVDMEVDAMTVLCIFNGPHNLSDPLDWNTNRFIEGAPPSSDGDEPAEGDENDAAGGNSGDGTSPPKRRRLS